MACLKLVHYIEAVRLELGGVVRAVLDMAQVMAEGGHEVRLLTADALDVPKDWLAGEPGKPHATVVPAVSLSRQLPPAVDEAVRWADVVHLHTPWCLGNPSIAGHARQHRRPYIVTLHGMLDEWSMQQKHLKKRLYLALRGRRFLEQAALVQCTAEAEKQQTQRWYPRGNPTVLPYIFNTDPYRELPGPDEAVQTIPELKDDKFKVLFLSRLHPKKGVEHLIDAAALLVKQEAPVRVFITGPEEPDYQQSLNERVRQHGISDAIVFTGPVYGRTKTSLYQAADVFVLPTSQENFGLVLTEAMACGTPVITTRGTDIWAEVQSAGGIIVPQEAPAIADAISELMKDPARCASLGEQGRKWVLERFDNDQLRRDYEAMYRQALAQMA
ncbi:MAG: glycosyltransferase [Phycisphaeraceae bacterium]